MRRYGRLAGFVFIFGALATVPSSLLIQPEPPNAIYVLTALGLASGLICLRVPWETLSPTWLNAVAAIGTLEVAIVCAEVDPAYRLLYYVIAVYAALVLRTRGEVALQVALIAAALFSQVFVGPDTAREAVRLGLLALPSLIISAVAVRFLVEFLARRERDHREFAHEAVQLAIRIRGPHANGAGERLDELARELERRR